MQSAAVGKHQQILHRPDAGGAVTGRSVRSPACGSGAWWRRRRFPPSTTGSGTPQAHQRWHRLRIGAAPVGPPRRATPRRRTRTVAASPRCRGCRESAVPRLEQADCLDVSSMGSQTVRGLACRTATSICIPYRVASRGGKPVEVPFTWKITGWFMIGWSAEYAVGDVKALKYQAPRRLPRRGGVLHRSGRTASISAPYIGHGGTVVGDCIGSARSTAGAGARTATTPTSPISPTNPIARPEAALPTPCRSSTAASSCGTTRTAREPQWGPAGHHRWFPQFETDPDKFTTGPIRSSPADRRYPTSTTDRG